MWQPLFLVFYQKIKNQTLNSVIHHPFYKYFKLIIISISKSI